ncbi:MAG: hypothetical protein V4819_05230 [Verrucomicrobiota bacterium]
MSNSARTLGELETGYGPAAHEDLTIAEQLQIMRVPGEHRPGEQCFRNCHGEHLWVGENEVQRFVAVHGADHSSDYLNSHGADWQEDFFSGN